MNEILKGLASRIVQEAETPENSEVDQGTSGDGVSSQSAPAQGSKDEGQTNEYGPKSMSSPDRHPTRGFSGGRRTTLHTCLVLLYMVGICHGATDRIAEIASQFNDGHPVLFSLVADLNGIKEALDGFWETANSYIFVRQGGIGDIDDINSDSAYSDIGYSSFMHNETFNTFFTNDGLGNGGYSGVIYNKSAWDGSQGYPSQPMVLMQGWMIDSWPDYRFISNKSLSENEQRYFGLQLPSGYKTSINFEYLENDYLTPEQVSQGYAIPAPPYVVGNRDDGGYFSYKINASELDEAAFVDYYRNTLNSSAGAFSTVEYVGVINEYKETGSNDVINVNFFQGFIFKTKASLSM